MNKKGFHIKRIPATVTLIVIAILLVAFVRSLTDTQLGNAFASSKRDLPVSVQINTEDSQNGGSRPIISAQVCGETVLFLLDTGGENSMLTESWKNRAVIAEQIKAVDSNGKRIIYRTPPMELLLGKMILNDVQFDIPGEYVQLAHGKRVWSTDGRAVLGQNILSRYHVVIDGTSQKLHLLQTHDLSNDEEWVSFVGFWGSNHLTVSANDRNGRHMRVFIDTGYELSRIAKEFAASTSTPIDIRIGSAFIVGYTPQVLEGGDITISNPEKGDIVINCTLGWDVLRNCRLEISYKHKKLRITQQLRQQGNALDHR
jgi:hypothetical protein